MNDKPVQIVVYQEYSEELINRLSHLEDRVFDPPYSKEKLKREASVKTNLKAWLAYQGNEAVGYKVGYEMTSNVFYSWIGGVIAEQRGKGIAKELMASQHQWAKNHRYKCVRTHTHNKYREMLILNIKSGFDIVGIVKSHRNDEPTIVLEKML